MIDYLFFHPYKKKLIKKGSEYIDYLCDKYELSNIFTKIDDHMNSVFYSFIKATPRKALKLFRKSDDEYIWGVLMAAKVSVYYGDYRTPLGTLDLVGVDVYKFMNCLIDDAKKKGVLSETEATNTIKSLKVDISEAYIDGLNEISQINS